jgi:hypothetical protein
MLSRRVFSSKLNFTLNKKFQKNIFSRFFSTSSLDLTMPIIDMDKFINKSQGWEKECKIAAECLHDTGIIVIKDPVKINF